MHMYKKQLRLTPASHTRADAEQPAEQELYCQLACMACNAKMHQHGVFGRFDLAALCGCHTLNVCYVMFHTSGGCKPQPLSSQPCDDNLTPQPLDPFTPSMLAVLTSILR